MARARVIAVFSRTALLLGMGLGCPGWARADLPDAAPSPDEHGSHERFRTLLDESRDTTYRKILALYDQALEANPDSLSATLERCQFIQAAAGPDYDEESDEYVGSEEGQKCTAQLVERFPNAPAVVQFQMDRLWGDDAISFGEATVGRHAIEWTAVQRGRFYKSLAFAYFARDKLRQAVRMAWLTRANAPSFDVSIIFATDHQTANRKREAVAEIVRSGVGEKTYAHQKVSLLLECGAFAEALKLIEQLQKAGVPVAPLVHAQALEAAGRTEAARAKYGELSAQQWNRAQGLERLFYIDLGKRDRRLAIASYAALRDLGFSADPLLRHRLALAFAFPSAAWHLRDLLGLAALLGLGLLLALLPGVLILPIHYLGLLRGPRASTGVPGSERWSLPVLWAMCAAAMWTEACVLYVFSYDELIALLSETLQSSQQSRAEVARTGLYLLLATAASVLVWLRKSDYGGLIRCSWSVLRIARSVVASLLIVFLIQAVTMVAARALGLSTAESDPASAGLLTTRELLRAILSMYGPWMLFALMALIVPIYEEVAFRSILLGSASKHLPFTVVNVLQSGLFMLLHDEPMRYPALFSIGLLAGRLTRRSGGLAPAIALHATINFLAACGLWLQAGAWYASQTRPPPLDGLKQPSAFELAQACQLKNADRCFDLAERYENGSGVARDYARSAELYRQACEAGLAPACTVLGVRYEQGKGVAKDLLAAASLYERACSGGSLFGCNNLGRFRQRGTGIAGDAARAAALYEKACLGGVDLSCGDLAWLRYSGNGVARDYGQSARLFARACDTDDPYACNGLGLSYELGQGVAQDLAKAAALYQRACDGEPRACRNLARLYEAGQGVAHDVGRAVELNRRACERGIDSGCEGVRRLEPMQLPEGVKEP